MFTINPTTLYVAAKIEQPLSAVTNTQLLAKNVDVSQSVEASATQEHNVAISSQARQLLATETIIQAQQNQQLENSNAQDLESKTQYLLNLELFIDYAQRYALQDVAVQFIENRAAIDTYNLIANKVVATVASNELQR